MPEPRLVLVLAGAASVGTRAATALERATMPHLEALAMRGGCGRLRAVAPHLPAEEASAHATLLGTALPAAIDAARVAAESVGASLAPTERCSLVEVLDHTGDPAPALHVARAVEVIRGRLPDQRVATVRRGNQLLLAGPRRPVMPEVAGLELRLAPAGWLPARPPLDERTVVVATGGSALLGVGRVLGARAIVVDGVAPGRRDPVPGRLREAAIAALLDGAGTVVVESAAALLARRGVQDEPTRERAVAAVLSRLDGELIGPLPRAPAWRRAAFVITAANARESGGPPRSGDVPVVVAGGRAEPAARVTRRAASDGSLLPPRYSERGVVDRPIVTSPFTPPPARDPDAPLRFTRDPATGVTAPAPSD